jgi:hypothetical protein
LILKEFPGGAGQRGKGARRFFPAGKNGEETSGGKYLIIPSFLLGVDFLHPIQTF